jgi:hypothetical protein
MGRSITPMTTFSASGARKRMRTKAAMRRKAAAVKITGSHAS